MHDAYMALTADIVAAYVTKNSVQAADVPALIQAIHASLVKIATGAVEAPPEAPKEPAVPIKKSVSNDYIICLEDGKKFKSLKRHLAAAYDLTPAAYRSKWGLPHDYPMVAPSYAAQRSELAKAVGLGSARKAAAAKRRSTKKVA